MRTLLEYFFTIMIVPVAFGMFFHSVLLWRGSVDKHSGVAGLLLYGYLLVLGLQKLPNADVRTVVYLGLEVLLLGMSIALSVQHFRLKWRDRAAAPPAGS
jgi:hypothetical protein